MSRKLKQLHNYKRFGDTCRNCKHFKGVQELEEGVFADSCHVDASPELEDGRYNPDQDVYVLQNPWGVCDEHERIPVRRDND